jgi:uncharacterized membrane protein YkvA (DUF1232 family)
MLRFAVPLLSMLMPRSLVRIIRYVVLVWRITFDKRVNIILRLLAPLALVYVLIPTDLIRDRIPILGIIDDFIVLSLSLLSLVNLSPKDIVDEHLGHRSENRNPSQVVDGSVRFIDE